MALQMLDALKLLIPGRTDTPTATIPVAAAYNALNNERRREVIEILAAHGPGERISAGDLADELARRGDDRTNAYISLIQSGLPCLGPDGHGLINYDPRAKTVTVRQELFTVHQAHQAFEHKLHHR